MALLGPAVRTHPSMVSPPDPRLRAGAWGTCPYAPLKNRAPPTWTATAPTRGDGPVPATTDKEAPAALRGVPGWAPRASAIAALPAGSSIRHQAVSPAGEITQESDGAVGVGVGMGAGVGVGPGGCALTHVESFAEWASVIPCRYAQFWKGCVYPEGPK